MSGDMTEHKSTEDQQTGHGVVSVPITFESTIKVESANFAIAHEYGKYFFSGIFSRGGKHTHRRCFDVFDTGFFNLNSHDQ